MPHKRPVTDNALDATGLDAIKRKKLDESLFSEVLSESGFILNYNNEPYTLETDQALFQRRLLKALRSHRLHCYPASVREFLRGLDAHCADTGRLKWALLYTQTASGCSAAARAGHQDSLLRLLLNTDELQPAVITLLQERLLEVAYSVSSDDDRSLPRLVLANLQRLDRLTDPAAVSEKMLELLQSAPPEVQKDIITFLPEIVDDSTHPKVAEELCRLYYSSPELSVTILDALPGLRLSAEALLEVKHSVQKTVQAARPEHLPVVVKFLLEDAGKADELIADLRRRIRLPAPSEQAAGAGDGAASQHAGPSHSQHRGASQHSASHEVALLQNIRLAFQLERRQHTAWLKALDGISLPEVHHPLDVLLLLQLHDAAPPRQRLVEAVLKKQVRARLFTRDVLRQTFTAHAQTLKQFVSTLCRLAAFLLRGSEASLVAYGTEMYRLAFVSFSGYQQQEVVLGLLSHASDPPAVRQAALRLCQTLADECPDALARYSGFLKGWLDLLEQLTLPEVRQLMEVLSTLAFRAPHEAATVGDELKLLIHKQLASSSGRYKRLGIVSVLMAIKCRQNSGDTSGATATSDDSQSSEIVLTTAGQRETAQLLQLAQTAVSSAAEARGLLLDELASLVWRAGVDPKIESWICDQQMDEFQEAFVVDLPDGEPQCEGLAVSLQHGLEEAAVGEIALNLAPMAMHSPERLVTLCAHFRLLRLCVASLDGGDMEKLDALLGCPVILPAELDPAVVSALPPAAQHATLTALFHCVNFFRELLNAFSTQKDQELKRRCVLRLRAVLQLESQISRLLPLVPGFVPPPAIFDCDAPPPLPAAGTGKKQKPAAKRKGKGGKAAARTAAGADATVNQSTSAVTQPEPTQAPTQGASAPPGSVPGLSGYRAFLRELDMDVYRLLYRRLSLTDHTTEEFCLRPSELRLLLDDLALKLERRLAGGGGGGPFGAGGAARALGFSHLDLLPEASVAKQAATLLKPLSVIADNIVTMFRSQIADNDGVLDGPGMFGEEMGLLSACLAAVYRIMATLLAWPGLQEPANKPLAQEAVSNLRLTDPAVASGVSQQPSQQLTAARAFALLERHAASVPQLESAVGLARALAALAELAGEPRLHAELADCAESLLKREWFSASGARETGGAHGARVAALLRLLLAPAAGPLLPRLERLAETALSELMEATGREPASETYPTLSKSTFGHYYRALFGALVTAMGGAAAADGARLEQWAAALRVFSQLVGCLRVFSGRGAVGVCLKHSRRLVDLFVRHAIPMLELMLKHQKEEVLTILKNFQLSARYLHHVCNHSKSLKDASLMQHVPYLKKGLEAFVFRVKAMLALNGCSDAFWMGNLKNRDLHGEEILSQRSVADEGGSGSEAEDAEEAEESDVDLDAADERSSPVAGGGSPDRATDNTGDKPESEVSDAY